jgi:hypothetical protein
VSDHYYIHTVNFDLLNIRGQKSGRPASSTSAAKLHARQVKVLLNEIRNAHLVEKTTTRYRESNVFFIAPAVVAHISVVFLVISNRFNLKMSRGRQNPFRGADLVWQGLIPIQIVRPIMKNSYPAPSIKTLNHHKKTRNFKCASLIFLNTNVRPNNANIYICLPKCDGIFHDS